MKLSPSITINLLYKSFIPSLLKNQRRKFELKDLKYTFSFVLTSIKSIGGRIFLLIKII